MEWLTVAVAVLTALWLKELHHRRLVEGRNRWLRGDVVFWQGAYRNRHRAGTE